MFNLIQLARLFYYRPSKRTTVKRSEILAEATQKHKEASRVLLQQLNRLGVIVDCPTGEASGDHEIN